MVFRGDGISVMGWRSQANGRNLAVRIAPELIWATSRRASSLSY
jgi:hypothetical protein